MNLGEVQDRVKNQFGDTSGAVITDADIARWATDAQIDIVRKSKCNETTTPAVTVAGTSSYNIANLLDVIEVTYDGRTIRRISRYELSQRFPSRNVTPVEQGTPTWFVVREGGIDLYPTPDRTGIVVNVTHNRRPSPVVNAGDTFEIPEQYHEDIVVRCLQRAYEQDGQWTAANVKSQEYTARIADTHHDTKHKNEASFPAIRVLPGDYGDAW